MNPATKPAKPVLAIVSSPNLGDTLLGVASSKGLKKGGLNTTTVADQVEGTSKGIATASSRASDAKEDLDWDD